MPVSPTYPGLYIEELPSSAHTITPAPTSIAVFVGYTHPFLGECATNPTKGWYQATEIFSFADYERRFGGLYRSAVLTSDVADAVYQFFVNGGSDAYVVPLKPRWYPAGAAASEMTPAAESVGGITFTSQQLTDNSHRISITIRNFQPAAGGGESADMLITFGRIVESHRGVVVTGGDPTQNADPNFIANRLKASTLVTVKPQVGAQFNATYAAGGAAELTLSVWDMKPPANSTTMSPADFTDVFKEDSSLDKVDIFNLLVLPGIADNAIWSAALSFCEKKRAFYIMDPPSGTSADGMGNLPLVETFIGQVPQGSPNGAMYFPYLKTTDIVSNATIALPPSGYVAGIYAKTDLRRGVWKAPAGIETMILNTTGVVEEGRMTDMRQGKLNPIGINVLRQFPGANPVVWGARTIATKTIEQWRYVPVRRTALFIEQTLLRNLGWVVFEPNDEPLWSAIRISVEGFMLSLFRQAAFQGSTPNDAFRVQCDKTTTQQVDIDNGIVNIIVAFRPLKPAEFVVIKIAQLAGQVQS